MVSDKDHDSFIRTVSKEARKIVITKIPNARGSETDVLFNISKKYLDDVEIIEDYKDAYEYVKGLNKPVCVTGSIYLVGAVKEYLSNKDSVEV